jgi:hypothetical protein
MVTPLHAPNPWRGEIRETNAQGLRYTVTDQNKELVAELNEYHRCAVENLRLIAHAPELLDELKNALAIITIESSHLSAFIVRAQLLIKEIEPR